MKNRFLIFILIISLAVLGGCTWMSNPPVRAGEDLPPLLNTVTVTEGDLISEPLSETVSVKTARIMAVGDNLIHDTVIAAGRQADGSYNFTELFEFISDYIAQADIASINQETIFTANPKKYGGYPMFGTPPMVGDAIAAAGFNVVLHASNHSLDKGSFGVLDTIAFWQEQHSEMTVLGIADSQEAYDKITIIEKNGISFALLNYTYGLNGLTPPDNKPYLVKVMDKDTCAGIKTELARARELADVVIVYPHWGSEYVYAPDSFQKEWTQIFADCGVDIVIGTHPHVLQKMETIERADGGNMLIYYSLGNFCSHQAEVPRMLGGLADITLTLQDGKINIEEALLIPVVTQIETGHFTTYFLSEYTDELAKKHKFNAKFGFSKYNPEVLWNLYTKITGLERF